jgi:glycosyltransferase involved in cell wall biosynthesis
MRIMHLLNHTNMLNGHVHAAVDLGCEQRRLGHEVCIASGGGDFDHLLAKNRVATRIVDHTRRPLTILQSIARLKRHIDEWKPDVIHAHMMTSAVLAYPVCKLTGVPLITTVHNEFEKSAILMGLGKRVIAVSRSVGHSMQRRGIPAAKMHVVLNGTIGAARLADRSTQAENLEHPNVVFVGGVNARKGVPDLIRAFEIVHAEFPAARLFIVGRGEMETEYRELARRTNCAGAIRFTGPVEDPYPYMLAADIFVLPSLADPAPLVISEAREARCAVIGTNVDGIPQLLEFGAAGMLVPPASPDRLASALAELLGDPATLRAWQEKSQFRINTLKIERVALETTAVYRSALAKPKLVGAASRAI